MSAYAAVAATIGVIAIGVVVWALIVMARVLDARFGHVGPEALFAVTVLGTFWTIIYRAARRNEDR